MFAVIRQGGKQHRVSENDRLVIERIDGAPGDPVVFQDILMLAEEGGTPLVGGAVPAEARVFAELVAQTRGPKILVFKKKRRKNHRRLNGHRQDQTVVRIRAVSLTGSEPVPVAGSPADAPAAAAAPGAGEE
jgi:large subunit ribosomal protein L21